MSGPTRTQVLRLYKDLLRYGENLKFTDKVYFKNRVKDEFLSGRSEKDDKVIDFLYQVCFATFFFFHN